MPGELYRTISFDDYRRGLRQIHDRVFSEHRPEDRPFRNPHWEAVLVPYGLNMEDDVFQAFDRGIRAEDDHEVVIADAELVPVEMSAGVFEWGREPLEEVRCSVRFGFVTAHIFGSSGTWGLARDAEDDFLCAAGSERFVRAVLQDLGGRDVVRDRFIRYAIEEMEARKDLHDRLLRSVGWRGP